MLWAIKYKRIKIRKNEKDTLKNSHHWTIILNYSCSENSNNNSTDKPPSAYEMMEVAFEGYPSTNDIKPMMESIMKSMI